MKNQEINKLANRAREIFYCSGFEYGKELDIEYWEIMDKLREELVDEYANNTDRMDNICTKYGIEW